MKSQSQQATSSESTSPTRAPESAEGAQTARAVAGDENLSGHRVAIMTALPFDNDAFYQRDMLPHDRLSNLFALPRGVEEVKALVD